MLSTHRSAVDWIGLALVVAGLATMVFGNLAIGLIATVVGLVTLTASRGAKQRDAHHLTG